MYYLSNVVTYLSRTAVAVMVLFILAIIWIRKTRQEKSESILNLKSKDQMNKAKQMENERSFTTIRLKTLFQPQDDK